MAKRRRNWDWPRIFGWFALLFAPARADARFARTKGDYVRMLLQCLLGIAALLLPRVLHALSGAMLGALGFSVLTFLNKTEGIPVSMSPAFVALFTFCFALALDALFQTNMQKYALEGGEALTGQAALQDTMGDLIVDFIGALAIAIAGYLSRKRGMGNRRPRPVRHKRWARDVGPRPPLVLPSALQHLARALLGDRVDQGADAAARLAVLLLQHGPVLVQKGDDVAPVVGHGELEPAVQVLQA